MTRALSSVYGVEVGREEVIEVVEARSWLQCGGPEWQVEQEVLEWGQEDRRTQRFSCQPPGPYQV